MKDNRYLIWAAVSGALATLVMALFCYAIAPAMSLPKLDFAYANGTRFLAPDGTGVYLLGGFIFLLGGIFWALLYAAFVDPHLPWSAWLKGLVYGTAVWLVASVLVMPLDGIFHPLVKAGEMPAPGFFGLGLGGWPVALTNLMAHAVYGVLLGVAYGYLRRPTPSGAPTPAGSRA